MRLQGKVALATGAGSGIGEAIGRRLAADGAKVTFNFHGTGEHAEGARRAAQETGGLALAADVSRRGEVETLVRETVARFGRLDIAVNNAGIEKSVPFLELGDEEWEKEIRVKLAPHRINVNNIAPGAIATPINAAVLKDPKAMEDAVSEIPWARFGRPEEVAAVAAFLAGEESDYVTGNTYYIDGGLTRQVTRY